MVVVPSRGFNLTLTATGAGGIAFGVLGAFSEGDIIRRLHIWFSTIDSGTLVLAATLGGSNDASQAGLASGSSVLSRSETRIGGVPAFRLQVSGGLVGTAVIPVGFEVGSGSRYMIIGWAPGNIGPANVNVGAEVVRVIGDTAAE